MKTGWIQYDGDYYYFDKKSGAMKTGWLQDVKADYFFPKIAGLKFPRRTSLILLFFLLEPFFP
jgi:hypothetical protein